MCGFVGYYGDGDWDRGRVVEEMKATIAHRGPDSDGTYTDETVSLGFRRLSIIDLDKGSQPMHSADERYVIVFNGEIYNYRELRKELMDTYGDVFLTDSDTEVLLAAYRRYGTETASKLRGMFAFVIYDKEEKKLYGARDYFGIKPFYYATMGNVFLFGSEIKGFLAHPAFSKKVDPEALKMYLVFQYSPLEKTLFQGVYKLLPGTWFTYQNGEISTDGTCLLTLLFTKTHDHHEPELNTFAYPVPEE
jgi:asparagine synthase (glutamine-hydrolysing)